MNLEGWSKLPTKFIKKVLTDGVVEEFPVHCLEDGEVFDPAWMAVPPE